MQTSPRLSSWPLSLAHAGLIGGALLLAATVSACNGATSSASAADNAKPALDKCEKQNNALQDQVLDLKKKLAIALVRPGTIKVDPSELMISGKAPPKASAASRREGNLSQGDVIKTIRIGKAGLQACYNRALKRDTRLHNREIKVTVVFSVYPKGSAKRIKVRPNYSSEMNDCMVKAIRRWRFPPFSGQPVVVEAPVTLKPKG